MGSYDLERFMWVRTTERGVYGPSEREEFGWPIKLHAGPDYQEKCIRYQYCALRRPQ